MIALGQMAKIFPGRIQPFFLQRRFGDGLACRKDGGILTGRIKNPGKRLDRPVQVSQFDLGNCQIGMATNAIVPIGNQLQVFLVQRFGAGVFA